MKPALTRDEWADPNGRLDNGGGVFPYVTDSGDISLCCDDSYYHGELDAADRHALAALCLHDQPFGFTREDVEFLRDMASEWASEEYEYLNLADRIDALLPPEETVIENCRFEDGDGIRLGGSALEIEGCTFDPPLE